MGGGLSQPSPRPCFNSQVLFVRDFSQCTLADIVGRGVLTYSTFFHFREARVLYDLFIPYLEGRVRFPAIKTHSVPNLLARSTASGEQPMKTEKSNSAGARINRDSRNKR